MPGGTQQACTRNLCEGRGGTANRDPQRDERPTSARVRAGHVHQDRIGLHHHGAGTDGLVLIPLLGVSPPSGNRLAVVGGLACPYDLASWTRGGFGPCSAPVWGERASHARKVASEGPD